MSVEQIAAKLMINELLPRLKRSGLDITRSPVTPQQLAVAAAAKHSGAWSTHDIRMRMDAAFENK